MKRRTKPLRASNSFSYNSWKGYLFMRLERVLIVDGYTDEPSGLGVPPYIDVYPRYIAGAVWHHIGSSATVHYVTVDEFRRLPWLSRAEDYDAIVFIAGITVPGKYLDGQPASPEELIRWSRIIEKPFKILAGPIARFGTGVRGGSQARVLRELRRAGFDEIVTGDVDEYMRSLLTEGPEKASPWMTRRDYTYADIYLVKGARIVRMHRRYGHGLTAEIETYRGCARWVSGGCSFCIEPLYGKPIQRDIRSIVREVEALYKEGVVDFRIGRQSDFYVIGSPELGEEEWPRPCPDCIESLLKGIRRNAPYIRTLHIDNANPGTIYRYPTESTLITKYIVRYHTAGDVVALGLETADPRVARLNNLNTLPDEAYAAIKLVNRYGSIRNNDGVPHLLPGLNFILGLPGETGETLELNREFLLRLLEEGYMVRRVNIRRLLVIPGTKVSTLKPRLTGKSESRHRMFVRWVRDFFDKTMLTRVFPRGTIIRNLYVEGYYDGFSYARPPGSYPPTVKIKGSLPYMSMISVEVQSVSTGRSLMGRIAGSLKLI